MWDRVPGIGQGLRSAGLTITVAAVLLPQHGKHLACGQGSHRRHGVLFTRLVRGEGPLLDLLPSAPSGLCSKPDSPGHSVPGQVFFPQISCVFGLGLLQLGVQLQAGLILALGTSGPQTAASPVARGRAPGLEPYTWCVSRGRHF